MPALAPMFAPVRRFGLLLSTALLIAVAGCAAPSSNDREVVPTADASAQVPAEAATPTPSRSPPPPTVERPTQRPSLGAGPHAGAPGGSTVKIDRSCNSDTECTVKDVGNCCGYYPACVNVDSPTDPEGVKAQCAQTGMASVCGFPAITSCQCVAGQCEGSSKALLE